MTRRIACERSSQMAGNGRSYSSVVLVVVLLLGSVTMGLNHCHALSARYQKAGRDGPPHNFEQEPKKQHPPRHAMLELIVWTYVSSYLGPVMGSFAFLAIRGFTRWWQRSEREVRNYDDWYDRIGDGDW